MRLAEEFATVLKASILESEPHFLGNTDPLFLFEHRCLRPSLFSKKLKKTAVKRERKKK